MGVAHSPGAFRRDNLMRGFSFGVLGYALVSWLTSSDSVKAVLWVALTALLAWWFSVNGGAWFDKRKGLLRSLLEGGGLIVAGLCLIALAGLLLPNPTASTSSMLPHLSAAQVLYLLVAIPMSEEILLRGLLFDLSASRSVLVAVLSSSLVDALAHVVGHGDPTYALAILPGSLILGCLRALSKGVSMPIAVHILVDTLAT